MEVRISSCTIGNDSNCDQNIYVTDSVKFGFI